MNCGLGGGIQHSFKPFSNSNRNGSSSLHGMGCEYYMADACGDTREQHEASHCDEHRRDSGHRPGMLGNNVVQHLAQERRVVARSGFLGGIGGWGQPASSTSAGGARRIRGRWDIAQLPGIIRQEQDNCSFPTGNSSVGLVNRRVLTGRSSHGITVRAL